MAVPAFEVLLRQLLTRRGMNAAGLAQAAGVAVSDVDGLLAGNSPDPALLVAVAPVLGWHAADLVVVAGHRVPDGLAAAVTRPCNVGDLLDSAVRLTPQLLARLRGCVREFPVLAGAVDHPRPDDPSRVDGVLVQLLANRNITGNLARTLCQVGDGPYFADAFVRRMAAGLVAVTPQYVSAFARVLDLPSADLATLTGVEPDPPGHPHPRHAELAALAWDARLLTSRQLEQTMHLAGDLWESDPRSYCYLCREYHEHSSSLTEAPRRDVARYAHTPAGALYAAVDHLYACQAAQADWTPTGFAVRSYTGYRADLGVMFLTASGGEHCGLMVQLEWRNGRWTALAAEPRPIEDPGPLIPWTGYRS